MKRTVSKVDQIPLYFHFSWFVYDPVKKSHLLAKSTQPGLTSKVSFFKPHLPILDRTQACPICIYKVFTSYPIWETVPADWSAFSVWWVSPSSGRQPNAVWRWRARRPHTHSALTDGVRSCPHDRTWPPSPRLLPVALFPWASSHGAPPGGALLVGLFSMGLFSGEAFLREAYSRHILGSGSHPRSSSLAGSFRTVSVHSTVSSHVKLWCHGRVDKI